MKKLVVSSVAVLGLTSVAFAGGLQETAPVAPRAVAHDCCEMTLRPYVNFGLGLGNTGWKDAEVSVQDMSALFGAVSRDVGFAWSMGIGCEFNKFFSAEVDYIHSFNTPRVVAGEKLGTTFAFALMGKMSAPIFDGFNLFAKLGPSLLTTRKGDVADKTRTNFNVAFGAGAEFKVTDDFFLTAEWLRIGGRTKRSHVNYQPAANIYTLGVRYVLDI